MPVLRRASAADLTRSSLMLQAKRFQLFQPMGGVRASPFTSACASEAQKRNPKHRSRLSKTVFRKNSMESSRRIVLAIDHKMVSPRARKTQTAKMRGYAVEPGGADRKAAPSIEPNGWDRLINICSLAFRQSS